jgi:alkyldihydroxyacetonephosphate synthase
LARIDGALARRLGVSSFEITPPPRAEEITLRSPRLSIPGALEQVCTTDHYERLAHSYGRSLADSIRIFRRDFSNPPDAVAFPRSEQDVADILDWCGNAGAAAVPFGGGSSVVGGVEPPGPAEGRYSAAVSIDLRNLNRVLEIDSTSQGLAFRRGLTVPLWNSS